ncbi:MAG TPA: ankyrin repeat domain-containing protein, partial [Candidatus Babeliaceae bacterium]|nr:ankyrin repeat domain-containing protein [Candidatus Babeliaceae bacterium]
MLITIGSIINGMSDNQGYKQRCLERQLIEAVRKSEELTVRSLIKKGASVNITYDGDPIVNIASSAGNIKIVDLLILAGASLESKDKEGRSPLYHAIANAQTTMVKHLLQLGASVHNKDRYGETPLHCAVYLKSSLKIVQALVLNGSVINEKNSEDFTPLHIACGEKNGESIVEYLLERGAEVQAVAQNQAIPIHYAIDSGNWKSVGALVEHGINPRVCERYGIYDYLDNLMAYSFDDNKRVNLERIRGLLF